MLTEEYQDNVEESTNENIREIIDTLCTSKAPSKDGVNIKMKGITARISVYVS